MNYRHAYHAANHADVLKHVVLTRVLAHLNRKDTPYRVIDVHAGIGVYDLGGVEAGKTREWEGGAGKMAAPFAPDVEVLLQPWRQVIALLNPDGALRHYPGSPEIAVRLKRPGDRLVANELHPDDNARLAAHFARDKTVTVLGLDAGSAIKANLPPPERRGLILIDPPYEAKDEAARAARMLTEGVRRFGTGVFMLWYPLKAKGDAEICLEAAKALALPGTFAAELRVREAFEEGGLAGSGVIVVNTPWKLDEELMIILPALAERLGLGTWGQATVRWLVPPA